MRELWETAEPEGTNTQLLLPASRLHSGKLSHVSSLSSSINSSAGLSLPICPEWLNMRGSCRAHDRKAHLEQEEDTQITGFF